MPKLKIWQWLVIGVVAWQIIAAVLLATAKEGLNGGIGNVWNTVQRAVEVMEPLQGQAEFFTADRQKLIDKITEARMGVDQAKASGDLAQLEQAMRAMNEIKVIVENYPSVDLSEVQLALMDETAGSINRVAFARKGLIDQQVGFNTLRLVAMPVGLLFPRTEVLGELSDPSSKVKLPKMGQGDFGDK